MGMIAMKPLGGGLLDNAQAPGSSSFRSVKWASSCVVSSLFQMHSISWRSITQQRS
jgi:hypothetical protein